MCMGHHNVPNHMLYFCGYPIAVVCFIDIFIDSRGLTIFGLRKKKKQD